MSGAFSVLFQDRCVHIRRRSGYDPLDSKGSRGNTRLDLGVVLPSFVVISIIARVLDQFQQLKAVQYAFYGIRAGVLALVLQSLVKMYKKCPKSPVAYGIMAASFVAATILDFNILLIIVLCGIVGLVSSNAAAKGE